MPRYIDLTGCKFGRLEVLELAGSTRKNNGSWARVWRCRCECGVVKKVQTTYLTSKKTKSCGCWRSDLGRVWILKAQEVSRQIPWGGRKSWKGYGKISGGFWYNFTRHAKRRNLPVSFTIQDAWDLFLRQNGRCAYTEENLVFDLKYGGRGPTTTASIDRKDSSLPYTLDNIHWVHKDINFLKQAFSEERFIELCHMVAQHNPMEK